MLKHHFYSNPGGKFTVKNKKAVQEETLSPFAAAQIVLSKYFKVMYSFS
jgi:hypothetical protein